MDVHISIQGLEYLTAGLCGITGIMAVTWLISIVVRLHMQERMEVNRKPVQHFTSKDLGKED